MGKKDYFGGKDYVTIDKQSGSGNSGQSSSNKWGGLTSSYPSSNREGGGYSNDGYLRESNDRSDREGYSHNNSHGYSTRKPWHKIQEAANRYEEKKRQELEEFQRVQEINKQNELARLQEIQRLKEIQEAKEIINESWERHKAIEAEKLDVINTALKLKAIQAFEASDLGKATKLVEQAEEVYDRKVKHLENIKKNIFYEKNKALAIQQVEQAAKQVEVFKAIKVKAEKDALEKAWREKENEKIYEQYAKEKIEQEKAEIAKVAERMKINSQEDQEFLTEKKARIDYTKKKLYEIEFNSPKHNAPEVEKYSPLIIKTLMQYSRDYEGFNRQIISDIIPIQDLHTLSLKKTDSVDSHAVNLIFDLLRDNHLPSLKTLDLSDNPKSIGADQIGKLADSFFSGNNNLETLDISCVYPPTTDLRAPFKASGERLVGDAYAGDYLLGHKLFELYCSVSTCKQPLSITLESSVSYPLDGCTIPTFNALHIPYILITHYIDWMGEPASFKTTSVDMVNHTRQILEKMIKIRDEQSLRNGGYEVLIKYQGDKVPHLVETFTWGITKCLAPKTLNKEDFEWVKDSLIDSPHDYHHLAKIMQLAQTKLDAFICVTEVMDDRIITHDMLNHQAEWKDAFPLDYFNKRYPKGGKNHITKESVLNGKINTESFDSSCKSCNQNQLASFFKIPYSKTDFTSIVKVDLSNSDIDDFGAKYIADSLEKGTLPSTKYIDITGNHITPTGDTALVKAMKHQTVQDIIILTYKLNENSKLLIGTKEEKIAAYKELIAKGKDKGTYDEAIVVDKSWWGQVKNTVNQFLAVKNGVFGFSKCHFVPEDIAVGYAQDKFIAKIPKIFGSVAKYGIKLIDVKDIVTCYLGATEEAWTSEVGMSAIKHELCVMGESEFCGE